jgi:hypothetical protein
MGCLHPNSQAGGFYKRGSQEKNTSPYIGGWPIRPSVGRVGPFVTFSCYRRQPFFNNAGIFDVFQFCLERLRRRIELRI